MNDFFYWFAKATRTVLYYEVLVQIYTVPAYLSTPHLHAELRPTSYAGAFFGAIVLAVFSCRGACDDATTSTAMATMQLREIQWRRLQVGPNCHRISVARGPDPDDPDAVARRRSIYDLNYDAHGDAVTTGALRRRVSRVALITTTTQPCTALTPTATTTPPPGHSANARCLYSATPTTMRRCV